MPRKSRVEFEGAVYHVMDRGDRQEPIFLDDRDRERFLETLGEACKKTGWRVHAYVLMGNHYHLMVETPAANLVRGMSWLQSTYTIRFNRRHGVGGHLFQGRYKAVVVDPEARDYFLTLADYIHLNPVRAGLVGADPALTDYPWSSLPLYKRKKNRPQWLEVSAVMAEAGCKDTVAGRMRFQRRTGQRAAEETRERAQERYGAFRRGWCVGSEEFKERLLEKLEQGGRRIRDRATDVRMRRDHGEERAKAIMARGLGLFDLEAGELGGLPKGDARKAAIGHVIRRETTVSLEWMAGHLEMGDRCAASRLCRKADLKLVERLERELKRNRKRLDEAGRGVLLRENT